MHCPAVLSRLLPRLLCAAALLPLSVACARADPITDWSRTTGDIVVASGLGPPPANRVMALVHTSVFDAVNAITKDIAKFWEATLPPIYHGLVQCLTEMPGREVTANARLFAVVSQAIDDAMIAVFDAKYHYAFWRPVTAIRNGEIDGNDATVADRTWVPFIDTPLHPEYPCAHCIVSATVATVLKAELGSGPQPEWMTSSSTANNAVRRWKDLDAYMEEVALARIYDGVHYRFSAEAGTQMGKQVGTLAVQRLLAGAN